MPPIPSLRKSHRVVRQELNRIEIVPFELRFMLLRADSTWRIRQEGLKIRNKLRSLRRLIQHLFFWPGSLEGMAPNFIEKAQPEGIPPAIQTNQKNWQGKLCLRLSGCEDYRPKEIRCQNIFKGESVCWRRWQGVTPKWNSDHEDVKSSESNAN